MAAGHPGPTDDYCRARKIQLETNTEVGNNIYVNPDQTDLSLSEVLHPVLISMRVIGQYFTWPLKNVQSESAENKQTRLILIGTSLSADFWQKVHRFYAVIMLSIIWFNAIRMLTIFKLNETPMSLVLNKAVVVAWHFQCAIQQSTFFFACCSGRLNRLLEEIKLESSSCTAFAHRSTRIVAAAMWLIPLISMIFNTYSLFFAGPSSYMMLTPFGTHLPISQISILQGVVFLLFGIMFPAYWFSAWMTFLLATVFSNQFCGINTRLRRAIGNANERDVIADVTIEKIRQQHQTLCRLVKDTDAFLKFYFVAGFLGPIVCIVIILYVVLFSQHVISNNPVLIAINVFWILLSSLELTLTTYSGVAVNHHVRMSPHHNVIYTPQKLQMG